MYFFQDQNEETPLFAAAHDGSLAAVRQLLAHGASRDITDVTDRLPRDVALENKHEAVVTALDEAKPHVLGAF